MCRNIKILFNFEPPASDAEIQAAAEQYVRKISGFAKPSAANEGIFRAGRRSGSKGVRYLAPLARDQRPAAESGGRSPPGLMLAHRSGLAPAGGKNADKIFCPVAPRSVAA